MGIGRQVADAYIDVHGDLSKFRRDLNKANAPMEKWAEKLADDFSKAWGKRTNQQMTRQWDSIVDAMHSGKRVDFNRMIENFDPSDLERSFEKINDMLDELHKRSKITEKDALAIQYAIGRQMEAQKKQALLEGRVAKDREMWGNAHKKMMIELAHAREQDAESEKKLLSEAFAENARFDALRRKMDGQAEAQRKRDAEAHQARIKALIESNDRWKESFAGIVRQAKDFDLDRRFKDLGKAMATNDWSGVARGSKSMEQMRRNTIKVAKEMRSLGRITKDEFGQVLTQINRVTGRMAGYNSSFRTANKSASTHSKAWGLIERSIGNAGKKFAGFSGLNVLGDLFRDGAAFFQDLDRNAVKIGKMALLVGTLGAAVVNMIGGIAVVGQDLAKLAQISVLGPAFLVGAGIQAGVLVAALKDIGEVLEDLGPRFGELQDKISSDFWEVAEQPIRNLVDTLLPTLSTKLGETATAWGGLFAEMADSLAAISTDDISTMFDRMNAGINLAKGAIAPLIEAFNTMGLVGSEYFERFGQWITDLSVRFNNFIQGAAADGRLNLWIEEAIQAFKDVWSILGSGISIFNSIGDAAEAAGIGGLSVLRANLEKVAALMSSEGFQSTLKLLFTGAAAAIRQVGGALLNLGPAITSFMPAVAASLGIIGSTVATLIGYIGQAISNQDFQHGLTNFLRGVQRGIEALSPAIEPMVNSLGMLGNLMGQVAGQVGMLVAVMATELSPILDIITEAFGRITFAAGPQIAAIIRTIADVAGIFVAKLLPPLEKLVMTVLPLIAPAFAAMTPIFDSLITGLVPVVGAITKIATTILTQLGPAFGAIKPIVDSFMKALVPVVDGITKIVDLVVPLLVPAFAALAPVIDAVLGVLTPIIGRIVELVGIIAPALLPAIEKISAALTPVIEVIGVLVDVALSVLVPVLGVLLVGAINSVVGVFEGFSNVVMGVVGIVTSIFTGFKDVFVKLFQGDIGGALDALGTAFSGVWDGIVQVIGGALELAWNLVNLIFIGRLVGGIKAALTSVGGFFKLSWDDIGKTILNAMQNILTTVTSGLQGVLRSITTILTSVLNFFKSTWTNITSTISTAMANMRQIIAAGMEGAKYVVTSVLNAIGKFFKDSWASILGTVTGALGKIGSSITAGMGKVGSTISSALGAAANFFRSGFINMVNATSNGISNVMGFISRVPGQISGALSGLGSLLWNAGSAIINGLKDGIVSAFEGVKQFVGGIASWIASHKGPISYDKVLLIPAGNAIMDGLGKGLKDKLGMLKGVLETVTDTMTDSVTNAFANNKMYLAGADAALGLADGLKSNKSAVANALSAVMPDASASVSASLVSTRPSGTTGSAEASPARAGTVIEAGAIVISTPTKNPEIVAAKVIDEFANYSNL